MDLATIQSVLREYISNELLGGGVELGVEENLLTDGLLDSVSVGRLVAFVDERFGYPIPIEDLLIDNLRSIEALSLYLQGRLGEPA